MKGKIKVEFLPKNMSIVLIVPSSNINMENEFHEMLPNDMYMYSARMRMKKVNPHELKRMDNEALTAAVQLSDAKVNAIAYGCTIAITSRKLGYHNIVRKRLEKATKTPVIISASAVLDAIKYMKIKKIAVATPYTKKVTDLEIKYFKGSGLDVVDYNFLGVEDNVKVGRISYDTTRKLVESLDIENAEGILISCAELPSAKIIADLERHTGLPVISTNTATLWSIFHRLDLPLVIRGYGGILEG